MLYFFHIGSNGAVRSDFGKYEHKREKGKLEKATENGLTFEGYCK